MKFSSTSIQTLLMVSTTTLHHSCVVIAQDIEDVSINVQWWTPPVSTFYVAHGWGDAVIGWLPKKKQNVEDTKNSASYDLYRPKPNNVNNWIKNLDGDRLLSSLSIPGTSRSLAYHRDLPASVRTQNFDIWQQLLAGIRYFDFPIYERKVWKSRIWSDHSVCPRRDLKSCPDGWPVDDRKTGDPSEKLSSSIVYFLKNAFWRALPNEFIIVRFRPDPRLRLSSEEELKHLASVFWRDMYELTDPKYKEIGGLDTDKLVFVGNGEDIGKLKVRNLRGKVLIITDFKWKSGFEMREYYTPWLSRALPKEPVDVTVNHPSDIEKKWRAVNKNIDLAAGSSSSSKVYITHASAVEGKRGNHRVTPETVATGGSSGMVSTGIIPTEGTKLRKHPGVASSRFRVSKDEPRHGTVEGMNSRLLRKFKQMKKDDRADQTGIVVMDFPGRELVQSIVDLNFKKTGMINT